MRRIESSVLLMTWLVGAILLVGCDSNASANRANGNKDDLQALGGAYHAYHDRNGQGPDSADDLINMLDDSAKQQEFANSTACQKLKSGEFVLNPRIQFREAKDLTKIPLLYEKQVPTAGGLVILGDASAQNMTAEEFKNLDIGDAARAEKK